MANRVTTLKVAALMSGGSTLVTAFRLATWGEISDTPARVTVFKIGAHANDKTNGVRQSTFKVGVHTNDKTNGVRATVLRANVWASLDQAFYAGEVFGSNEVFEPDFGVELDLTTPEPPVIEVNPFRAAVPNDDLQRILREQHNFTQAGDSTFHWGVLTEISNEALYTLGSVGRFYHDDLGIIVARYCRFVDFNPTDGRAIPVGLRSSGLRPWTVTNQYNLSAPNQCLGIALPYNDEVHIGEWYGWVITQGHVPVELNVEYTNLGFEFGTEYGWSGTGTVKQQLDVNAIGYRSRVGGNLRLNPGDFYVNVDRSSLGRANGLITTRLAPLVSSIDGIDTRLLTLEATVAGHTVEIGAINSRHTALATLLATEIRNMSSALSAIRSLMPDSNFKEYVDTSIENLTGYVDVNLSLVGGNANAALLRANEAYALAESISYDAIQVQINALNSSMGGLTDRLIGFKVTMDTNLLTAGQVLASYLYDTDVDGVNYYDFRPLDFKFASLLDVDVTTPPTNGQVPIWDNTAQKWIPGDMTGGGGGGGSTPWELIEDYTIPGAIANHDVDVTGYTDIQMLYLDVTSSANASRSIRFSTDGGVSFFAGGTDYNWLSFAGVKNNNSCFSTHATGTTAARTGAAFVFGIDEANGPKIWQTPNNSDHGAGLFVANNDPITHIRYIMVASGNLTGGRLITYGRPVASAPSGGGRVLLNTLVAAGGETVLTASGLPATHADLEIISSLKGNGAASISVNMKVNNDSSAIYDLYRVYNGGNDSNVNQTSFVSSFQAANTIADLFLGGQMTLHNYSKSDRFKTVTGQFLQQNSSSATGGFIVNVSGKYKAVAAINQLDFTMVSGAYAAGSEIRIYGVD